MGSKTLKVWLKGEIHTFKFFNTFKYHVQLDTKISLTWGANRSWISLRARWTRYSTESFHACKEGIYNCTGKQQDHSIYPAKSENGCLVPSVFNVKDGNLKTSIQIPGNPGTPGRPGSPFIPLRPGRPGLPWINKIINFRKKIGSEEWGFKWYCIVIHSTGFRVKFIGFKP